MRFGYDEYPFMIFEPVPCWWSSRWLLPLWIAALVALGLTALGVADFALRPSPLRSCLRFNWGGRRGLTDSLGWPSLFVFAIMLIWVFTITLMLKDFVWVSPAMDGWVIFLRLISAVIFIVGAVIAVWNALAVLRSGAENLRKSGAL